MKPVYVTVVLQLFSDKPTIFRNVRFDDAMEMIAGRRRYKLIFGDHVFSRDSYR